MKYYFRNLLTAICGKNPYRQELDKVKEEMAKADDNVNALRMMYGRVLDSKCETEKRLAEYDRLMQTSEKQLSSFQTLVENLRDRGKEKDATIDQLRKDFQLQVANYEKRVSGYSVTIAELQKKIEELTDKKNRQARGKEKKSKTKQEPKTEA